jgi:hypothetical protein
MISLQLSNLSVSAKKPSIRYDEEKRHQGKRYPKKSVRFTRATDIRWILPKGDFLAHHRIKSEAIWYSRTELNDIKAELTAALKLLLHSSFFLDPEVHCTRGLDSQTPYASKKRRQSRHAAQNAVMKEQDEQWETTSMDAVYCDVNNLDALQVRIANAYRRHSAACQIAARQWGIRDEHAARYISYFK